jgi:hypothetical protein
LPADWRATTYLVVNDVIPNSQKLQAHLNRIADGNVICRLNPKSLKKLLEHEINQIRTKTRLGPKSLCENSFKKMMKEEEENEPT